MNSKHNTPFLFFLCKISYFTPIFSDFLLSKLSFIIVLTIFLVCVIIHSQFFNCVHSDLLMFRYMRYTGNSGFQRLIMKFEYK